MKWEITNKQINNHTLIMIINLQIHNVEKSIFIICDDEVYY